MPTAYCGALFLSFVHQQLASISFSQRDDPERYLSLITDYARVLEQFAARTAEQAKRGIRMSREQVLQAQVLFRRLKANATSNLSVAPNRIEAIAMKGLASQLEWLIESSVAPAFDRILAGLDDDYLARAPGTVGLGQYPQGAEIYSALVKIHTTLDLTAEQVHARGLERIAEIDEAMHDIQSRFGFGHDRRAFVTHLEQDARWRAADSAAVAQTFQRYIDRLEPHLNDLFMSRPRARYSAEPLSEGSQAATTFGYYDSPTRERNRGIYYFNGTNLAKQALFNVAALTYHELMPGHHMHLATQQENPDLHPLRAHSFVNAYNEGWAEYASTLAGEIGMYTEPEERYGRLSMDSLFTCRLVVDTGMNAMGWSLKRARQYMREHTALSEAEVRSESLRYACDIPGHALAYKLGEERLLRMRENMRRACGSDFDLKQFHAAVLRPGALPLPDLEWHQEQETQRLRGVKHPVRF